MTGSLGSVALNSTKNAGLAHRLWNWPKECATRIRVCIKLSFCYKGCGYKYTKKRKGKKEGGLSSKKHKGSAQAYPCCSKAQPNAVVARLLACLPNRDSS